MRNVALSFIVSLFIAAMPAYAGSGHGHSHDAITQDAAMEMATKKLEELVAAGKLDKSWSGVAAKGAEQKAFAKGPEWVVTFVNPAVADEAKRTLYIFYALDGHYLAANFTGN